MHIIKLSRRGPQDILWLVRYRCVSSNCVERGGCQRIKNGTYNLAITCVLTVINAKHSIWGSTYKWKKYFEVNGFHLFWYLAFKSRVRFFQITTLSFLSSNQKLKLQKRVNEQVNAERVDIDCINFKHLLIRIKRSVKSYMCVSANCFYSRSITHIVTFDTVTQVALSAILSIRLSKNGQL